MKFTKFEIAEYVCGWLLDNPEGTCWFDLENIESALANARGQLMDEQDGIEAHFRLRTEHFKLNDNVCNNN